MPSSNSTNGRRTSRSGPKAAAVVENKSIMVVLHLSSDTLSQFLPPAELKEYTAKKAEAVADAVSTPVKNEVKDNSTKDQPSSPASSSADAPVPPSSVDNASDAASTPATGGPSAESPRRKGVPGPKPGSKRGLHQTSDPTPRARGKPGPKKKPRLDDGAPEPAKPLPAGHRLGPKANTGAINAGLRALDRTGAPCRRWERKPLQLKSFTGIQWGLHTWRSPKPPKSEENGEAKTSALETGDSDSKANQSASGVPSEKSTGEGDLTPLPPNIVEASSPAPAIAMTA